MAVKERLLKVAESDYEEVLNKSVSDFKGDLRSTTARITDSLTQFSGDILGEEMDRYKNTLKELREKTEQTRSQAQTDVERHQAELEALIVERQKLMEQKLVDRYTQLENQAAQEINNTKRAYIERIDAKLADSVTSFLSTTLQYNADIGAQEQYLIAELEKHKNELIQEVASEL
jgi:monoamine oxidase